jgi:hypothetical protein
VLDRWTRRDLPGDEQTGDDQNREPVFLFAYGVPAQP